MNWKINGNMKIISVLAIMLAIVGCRATQENCHGLSDAGETGIVSLGVKFEKGQTKSMTDYTEVQKEETMIHKVCFMVFDSETGLLNSLKVVAGGEKGCSMSVPVGEKVIYAIVNGPYPGSVRKISDIDDLEDMLSEEGMGTVGLTAIGKTVCMVGPGTVNDEKTIVVRWLASRVVLSGVTCNIPQQHGGMTIDCVFLGNVNTKQRFGGGVSCLVNENGLSGGKPVGKDGVTGDFSSYLYRKVDDLVNVGDTMTDKYHMYCQPDDGEKPTCLYLLVTISGVQYYYRVPLTGGLKPNMTCSVELKITNLGSTTPPDGDAQKGEIQAVVSFDDWQPGNYYVEEF